MGIMGIIGLPKYNKIHIDKEFKSNYLYLDSPYVIHIGDVKRTILCYINRIVLTFESLIYARSTI